MSSGYHSRQAQQAWVYLQEADRWKSKPLWEAMLERLRQKGCPGVTVLRGLASYGSHGIHTAHVVELSSNLPILLTFVDSSERVSDYLEILLAEFGARGLVMVKDVTVLHTTREPL